MDGEHGWIVGNGNDTEYRTWEFGLPVWTKVRSEATRYHRKEDAEAVHAEDEEVWTIIPYDPRWRYFDICSALNANCTCEQRDESACEAIVDLIDNGDDDLTDEEILEGERNAMADVIDF